MSIVSDNIKRLRIKADMEQLELAEKLGISNKTVSSWECGRTEPRMEMIEKICNVLHCTKSDLVDEQPTVIMGSDAMANRVLKYAEMLHALSPEARDRILHYIDYETQKERNDHES